MKRTALCYFLFAASLLMIAQGPAQNVDLKDKPPTPPAPQKISVPPSPAKDALYAAIRKKDLADIAANNLQLKVMQLQQQIQQQSQQLDAQQKAAQVEVDKAEAALLKEMKLDPEKFSLNRETMEATAKAEPPKTAEVKK